MTRPPRTPARLSHVLAVSGVVVVSLFVALSLIQPAASAPGEYPWVSDQQLSDVVEPNSFLIGQGSDTSTFFLMDRSPFATPLVLQKIWNADASKPWGPTGKTFGDQNDRARALAPDASGGASIATDNGVTHEAKVYHFNSSGVNDWTSTHGTTGSTSWSTVLAVGPDVVHIYRDGTNSEYRLRRYAIADGAEQWPSPSYTAVPDCDATGNAASVDISGRIVLFCGGGTNRIKRFNADTGALIDQQTASVTPSIDTLLSTSDGGFVVHGSYASFGDHSVIAKFSAALVKEWQIDTLQYYNPSISSDGAHLFVGVASDGLPPVASPSGIAELSLTDGSVVWSKNLVTTCGDSLNCLPPTPMIDDGGIHAYSKNDIGGLVTGRYAKLDVNGNFLIGSEGSGIRIETHNISGTTNHMDNLLGVPDGSGGAVFGFITLFPVGQDILWGNRIEGPTLPSPDLDTVSVPGSYIVYDGVLQVTDGSTAPVDTLEFGNNGTDIASTGSIFFLPGGSAVASVPTGFSADGTSRTQVLTIGAGASGLSALTTKANNAQSALYAEHAGAGYAGYFAGNVRIEGLATVGNLKPAIVPTSRGRVSLYIIESPDVRFEDVGRATLVNGQATVTLDPTFRETIEGDYRVQLTAEGEPANLQVIEQRADTFVVTGDRDVPFVYRIDGARRGFAGVRFSFQEVMP